MPDAEDELAPPEPFVFETDLVAQEEAAAQEPTAQVLDLNEHAEDQQQDDQEF